MSVISKAVVSNRLLKSLSVSDFALLAPHLEPVDLALNSYLIGSVLP